MKQLLCKYGNILATFAIAITKINANTTCVCIMHQDRLPEEAKELRKF